MEGVLANIYSRSDAFKRRLIDALRNPRAAAEQLGGRVADDLGAARQMISASTAEALGGTQYGPASQALAMKMAEGYNPAGILVGPASKTWNQVAAQKAQELTAKGVPEREIWRQTGTFRGRDGVLRQEIDDSAAAIKRPSAAAVDWLSAPGPAEYPVGSIADLIDHPQLINAYPDLASVRATLKKGTAGSYLPNDGFSERVVAPAVVQKGAIANPENTKSVTLHELQHAIQLREGMARGGGYQDEEYKNLLGEVEARAAQKRMNYTPEQRREIFPPDDYDVSPKKLLVKSSYVLDALRKRNKKD